MRQATRQHMRQGTAGAGHWRAARSGHLQLDAEDGPQECSTVPGMSAVEEAEPYCWWCGMKQSVGEAVPSWVLCQGPGTAVCSDCVDLLNAIIADAREKNGTPPIGAQDGQKGH